MHGLMISGVSLLLQTGVSLTVGNVDLELGIAGLVSVDDAVLVGVHVRRYQTCISVPPG